MEDLNCWQSKFESCYYSDRLIDKIILINEKTNNKIDVNKIKKAIYYAKKYHVGQKRESGEPYYSHPLAVAEMVLPYCCKTDILIISILHDTIEDTQLTKDMISNIFGSAISNSVEKLTKIKFNKKLSAAEIVKCLWLQDEYELLIIKQFDRLHNMQSISVKNPIKIKKTVSETIEVFLILSVYLELNVIELQLTKLCAEFFPVLSIADKFHRFLTAGENIQLLALVFQNDITHKRNL